MSISRFSSLLVFTLFTVAASACGSEGPAGEMGDPGSKGDMGTPGTMGDPGTPGGMGTPGTNGTNGSNGSNGSNGTNGAACWDLNSNGACDAAAEDKNTDTMCTPLDCQGAPGAIGPTGPAGATAGQAGGTALGSALLTLAPNAAALIPGLTINFTVPATGQFVAVVSTHGTAAIADTDPDTFAAVTVFAQMDAAALPGGGGIQNMVMFNGAGGEGLDHWSMSTITPILVTGNHAITVNAANVAQSVSDVEISGGVASGFRGAVSVLLLKL